jgi:hypothetical protein
MCSSDGFRSATRATLPGSGTEDGFARRVLSDCEPTPDHAAPHRRRGPDRTRRPDTPDTARHRPAAMMPRLQRLQRGLGMSRAEMLDPQGVPIGETLPNPVPQIADGFSTPGTAHRSCLSRRPGKRRHRADDSAPDLLVARLQRTPRWSSGRGTPCIRDCASTPARSSIGR